MKFMFQTLKLVLPALIPSWRFFDTIAPSPRIEFSLIKNKKTPVRNWKIFRPRPVTISFFNMMTRMVWNPRWNDNLFLVSCAERLMQKPTEHSYQEILNRIQADIKESDGFSFVQFRLIFTHREEEILKESETFLSDIHEIHKGEYL
ncbi:MAG: hypothetical protein JKY60_20275 [Kordiimonadaceae bacterium]|nr:hypothetical protein [Kordiimonadaceae bacterium]